MPSRRALFRWEPIPSWKNTRKKKLLHFIHPCCYFNSFVSCLHRSITIPFAASHTELVPPKCSRFLWKREQIHLESPKKARNFVFILLSELPVRGFLDFGIGLEEALN